MYIITLYILYLSSRKFILLLLDILIYICKSISRNNKITKSIYIIRVYIFLSVSSFTFLFHRISQFINTSDVFDLALELRKRECQRGKCAASSDIDPHSSNTTLSPSCAVSPSDDVFRMSDSPPSDPAECRGIRNWGLACHKY